MIFWNLNKQKKYQHKTTISKRKTISTNKIKTVESLPLYLLNTEIYSSQFQGLFFAKCIILTSITQYDNKQHKQMKPIPQRQLALRGQFARIKALFIEITIQSKNLWGGINYCGNLIVYFANGDYIPISKCCKSYIEIIFKDKDEIIRCNNRLCKRRINKKKQKKNFYIKRNFSIPTVNRVKTDKLQQISKILDQIF